MQRPIAPPECERYVCVSARGQPRHRVWQRLPPPRLRKAAASATTAAALEQLKIIGVSRDPDHSDTTVEGFALRVMICEHILGNNVAGI